MGITEAQQYKNAILTIIQIAITLM